MDKEGQKAQTSSFKIIKYWKGNAAQWLELMILSYMSELCWENISYHTHTHTQSNYDGCANELDYGNHFKHYVYLKKSCCTT